MNLKSFIIIPAVFLLLIAPAVSKASVSTFDHIRNFPVLDEGRLKPLDTFARNLLVQFSGKDHVAKEQGIEWLCKLLFRPDATLNDKIFLINNPDVAAALGITAEQHRRYTPSQLIAVYNKLAQLALAANNIPEKERSLVENELLRIFSNINVYTDLARTFDFLHQDSSLLIHSATLNQQLGFVGIGQEGLSYIDLAFKGKELRELTRSFQHKSKSEFTADEKELFNVTARLYDLSTSFGQSPLLTIHTNQQTLPWISPVEAITTGLTDEKNRQFLLVWYAIYKSYLHNDAKSFKKYSQSYLTLVSAGLTEQDRKYFNKFNLELKYHAYKPFFWAIIFYIFTFIVFVISFASSKPFWYQLAVGLMVCAFLVHLLGLIARIIIMNRPPVTNLYETFIFVGFIAVFLGLIIEFFNRRWLGLVTAAISGAALLFISARYSADGDTLKMLVAVLNSNFWLATHVTTITMGYAAACVAGILGHIWLIQAALKKDKTVLDNTYKTTLGIMGVALTLTFLGTNLGGVWADQSWGRFWGWDPKENGALMIVLWLALLFHAKVARLIDALGMAIGAVLGMIVVMWAWFGVNLLSIGLHSYGFAAGLATNLIIYVIAELIFIIIFWKLSTTK